MHVLPTELPGVLVIQPEVSHDPRGFFLESWQRDRFNEAVGREVEFLQDNHSRSLRGVLRGLHWQREPMSQAKLIAVMQGDIFDVAVDVRPGSSTFGRWVGEVLSGESRKSLWIPEGFGHGFLVLSETADVVYKASNFYSPAHECSIRWNDPFLGISWPDPGVPIVISEKDESAPLISDAFGQQAMRRVG